MILNKVYKQYPKQNDCVSFLEEVRWNGVPICPYCNSKKQTPMPRELRYHCNNCRSSFSVTTQTIFHKTKVELQKWFAAIPLVVNDRISARRLAVLINVTKDTACFMVNRITLGIKQQPELIKHFLN